jgi:peptidyl-tRNA hydrolase, PTH1 family
MGQPIELIAGLGNPGPEYLMTRHNAGFWLVDALAAREGARFSPQKKLEAEAAEVTLAGQRVRLLKPMTFMNLSGRAVARALSYYKIPTAHLLVAYDEIDFPTGKVRLRFGGGHAGHNGMRSIIEHVGPDFWRIRIGAGHPGTREQVKGHVLRRASASDEELMLDSISRAIDVLPTLIEHGGPLAQNRLHVPETGSDTNGQANGTGRNGNA